MRSDVGKPNVDPRQRASRPGAAWPGRRRAGGSGRIACFVAVLSGLSACGASTVQRTISVHALACAPARSPGNRQRHFISDLAALRPLYQPVGRRMGIIQVRTAHDWEQLARATPQIGPCPDLSRGIVVGLTSAAGTPLAGGWPFCWETIRLHDGAGWIDAHFNGGNYLPDGTTYLETAYVEDLNAVLVVAVDGVRYYPP